MAVNPYSKLDWASIAQSFRPTSPNQVGTPVYVCPTPHSKIARIFLQQAAQAHRGYVLHKAGVSWFFGNHTFY